MLGGLKAKKKASHSTEAQQAKLQLSQWEDAIGKVFEMFDAFDESRTETFKLLDAAVFPDNGCVYLLMKSEKTGKDDVFSYDESDPTHIVKSVDGAADLFAGADLISYNTVAEHGEPGDSAHAYALFGR